MDTVRTLVVKTIDGVRKQPLEVLSFSHACVDLASVFLLGAAQCRFEFAALLPFSLSLSECLRRLEDEKEAEDDDWYACYPAPVQKSYRARGL